MRAMNWISLWVLSRGNMRTRVPELGMIEAGIQPFLFQKLLVCGMGFGTVGMLDDTALVQNQDHIRAQNGAEPVGNDQTGAPLHNPFQGLLNEGLALAVQITGGLVQH